MDDTLLVLDATAFYSGLPYAGTGRIYSTEQVAREIGGSAHIRAAREVLAQQGRLVIVDPSQDFLRKALEVANDTGDAAVLSDADVSVLALALQLKSQGSQVAIVSDDFAIQNVAKRMAIAFKPLMTKGITKELSWTKYCRGCGKRFSGAQPKACDVCGTRLTRRARVRT